MTDGTNAAGPGELDWIKDQIRDLRGKLREIQAHLHLLGLDREANVPQQIEALTATVELLAADLANALSAGKAGAPAAIDWPRIPHDQYRAEIRKLSEWVDTVLVPYYPGSAPAECWRNHPDAVITLSVLHLEYERIYDAETPALRDALDFHDRWMPNAIRRVKALTANCNSGPCARIPRRASGQ